MDDATRAVRASSGAAPLSIALLADRREPMQHPENGRLRKVAYTMYAVRDSKRARAFYEETLGLVRGASHGDWTEYDLPDGGCLLLGPADDLEPAADAGGRVSFEVEDLDALVTRLTSAGVTFMTEMRHTPVCRMIVARDSEGNSLILHELKRR
jgi:predicted enzyme related to lactoylglutathione lyase